MEQGAECVRARVATDRTRVQLPGIEAAAWTLGIRRSSSQGCLQSVRLQVLTRLRGRASRCSRVVALACGYLSVSSVASAQHADATDWRPTTKDEQRLVASLATDLRAWIARGPLRPAAATRVDARRVRYVRESSRVFAGVEYVVAAFPPAGTADIVMYAVGIIHSSRPAEIVRGMDDLVRVVKVSEEAIRADSASLIACAEAIRYGDGPRRATLFSRPFATSADTTDAGILGRETLRVVLHPPKVTRRRLGLVEVTYWSMERGRSRLLRCSVSHGRISVQELQVLEGVGFL